jgi:hypothetical protein
MQMKKQWFLLDTHVHTSEVSSCGKVFAQEMVRYYKAAGYDGIIVTDHYYDGYFELMENQPWEIKVGKFLSGYKAALEEGERIGLNVMLGMEIRFYGSVEDYLVYGFDESFLIQNPELYKYTLESFKKLADNYNILIFQAHPFRAGMRPADPALLHGVEVFNGNPRHDSHNDLAYEFAAKNGLLMIAGSDAHQPQDVGRAGICLSLPIYLSRQLVGCYRELKQVEIAINCNEID